MIFRNFFSLLKCLNQKIDFGTERLIGLSQADVDERVQEFVDLVQFDIDLV